jgi:hypothetical protein
MYRGFDTTKPTFVPKPSIQKREIVPAEQRKAVRKVLKAKAILAMNGQEAISIHTMDISATGISLGVPHPLAAGQQGQVAFSIFFDGKAHPVNALIKVVHCVFGGDEFKAGCVLTKVDAAGTKAIAQYFQLP